MADELKLDITPLVTLVEGVRDDVREVGSRIDGLSQTVAKVATDHAERITRSEGRLDGHDHQFSDTVRRLDEHGRKIGELEDKQNAEDAATKALQHAQMARVDWRHWMIGTIVFALAVIPGFLALFYH